MTEHFNADCRYLMMRKYLRDVLFKIGYIDSTFLPGKTGK